MDLFVRELSLSLTGGSGWNDGPIHGSGPNGYSNATISPIVSTSATAAMAGVYTLQ